MLRALISAIRRAGAALAAAVVRLLTTLLAPVWRVLAALGRVAGRAGRRVGEPLWRLVLRVSAPLRRVTFEGIVERATRRPLVTVAVVGILAIAAAAAALRLEPSAGTDTLVSRSSDSFKATERYREQFGDDAVVILVDGDLQRSVLTSDLGRLIALEGCISGNVPPEGLGALPPVCSEFAEFKPAKVVYGPGTFINTAADQILRGFQSRQAQTQQRAEAAAEAARRASRERGDSRAEQRRLGEAAANLVQQEFLRESLQLALRYGLSSLPSVDNVEFVSQLVFDPSRGVGVPKARFAYLFPSSKSALIQVRMRPELSEPELARAIDLVRRAVGEERFKLQRGGTYVVSGVPVVVEALADELQSAIFILLGAALLVMAGTLAIVFRSRLRLLPLALALAAAALAFGAVSLAGAGLTMASIAALPVLIGLAVDYAIQFQARYDEERWAGDWDPDDPPEDPPEPPRPAARRTAVVGGPTIAAAGISTIVGFLVLLLSPVPMVRGFGVLLVLGIALAFACALTAGFAVLVRFGDPNRDVPAPFPRTRAMLRRTGRRIADSRPGLAAGDRIWGLRRRTRSGAENALWTAIERPRRILAIGLALAVVGWAADTQTEIVSDIRELVPGDLPALKDAERLQEVTGVSGQIDVTVEADDLTRPEVISWMTRFQRGVLEKHGYRPGATCAQKKDPPELCPAFSLPDLFRGDVQQQETVRGLLGAVPEYFSQGVINRDRTVATLAFGIRLMPLERQKEVIDDIERRLDPPPGVRASVAGLPVLAAEANSALSSSWRRAAMLLAGLLAVFGVLYLIRRQVRLAAVPLIPIALATGWSALILFVLRIPLNPMSATLGALVIAISTEFSVLLSARYQEERAAGADPAEAIQATYASTGAAVLASGATSIAGFGALMASDIRMLRDFGAVTVIDLTASLLGVMLVLPAALVWAEQHGPFRLADLDPRRLAAGVGRPRMPRPRLPRPGRPRLPRPGRPRLRRPRVARSVRIGLPRLRRR